MHDPKQTEFERGSLWALKVLQEQFRDRYDKLRALQTGTDPDTSGVLNGMMNLISGLRVEYETLFMKGLRNAIEKDKEIGNEP